MPPPPPSAETGLAAPTRVVKHEARFPFEVLDHVLKSYRASAGAAALKAAGRLTPGLAQAGTSPFACSGGGNISWTNPAQGQYAYSYNACRDSGYTFTGSSTAQAGAGGAGWQKSFAALQAGTLADLAGTVDCWVPTAGAAARCLVTHGGWVWGFDARYGDGKANGTHRDVGPTTWNVTFTDFTTTTGTVVAFGTDGTASLAHGATDKDTSSRCRRMARPGCPTFTARKRRRSVRRSRTHPDARMSARPAQLPLLGGQTASKLLRIVRHALAHLPMNKPSFPLRVGGSVKPGVRFSVPVSACIARACVAGLLAWHAPSLAIETTEAQAASAISARLGVKAELWPLIGAEAVPRAAATTPDAQPGVPQMLDARLWLGRERIGVGVGLAATSTSAWSASRSMAPSLIVGLDYRLSERSRSYVDTVLVRDGNPAAGRDMRVGIEFKSARGNALGLSRGTLLRMQLDARSQVQVRLRGGGLRLMLRSHF